MGLRGVERLNRRLAALAERLPAETIGKLQRVVGLEGLRGVVFATPVDTGRARANWQVGIGSIPSGEARNEDPYGAGAAVIASAPPYVLVAITNNTPYIEVLENGGFRPPNPGPSSDPRPGRKGRILVQDGYSIQAPQGMLRVAIERIRGRLDGAV